MTLQLKLIDLKNSLGSKKPSYIYIQGGQSGSLRLIVNKLPQTIKCSAKDHLQFIICGSDSEKQPQQNDIISKVDFWAQSMLDQNRQKWQISQSNAVKYVVQYFNSSHDKLGELVLEVRYNRGLFYQGQIQALDAIRHRLVPFYTGQCPTFNFYNCLDSRNGGATFNFIEHVYRDS